MAMITADPRTCRSRFVRVHGREPREAKALMANYPPAVSERRDRRARSRAAPARLAAARAMNEVAAPRYGADSCYEIATFYTMFRHRREDHVGDDIEPRSASAAPGRATRTP